MKSYIIRLLMASLLMQNQQQLTIRYMSMIYYATT